MENPLLLFEVTQLIRDGQAEAVRDFLGDYPVARQAELIEDLEVVDVEPILRLLEPRHRAEIVSYFDSDRQVKLIESIPAIEAAALLRDMPHDDRADLVNRLDDDTEELILRRMAQAERDDIKRLTEYAPGTAGSVMTTDYATLPPFVSVREAIDYLRREAPDRETILTSYVVDHQRRLLGSISLQALILARPTARVEDVMRTETISARVGDDREEVAHKIAQYDLLALPIIGRNEMLVGIVTHDDAIDILSEEQSEDLLRFGGVDYDAAQSEDEPGEGGIVAAVRRRIVWLLVLFLAAGISTSILLFFSGVNQDAIESFGFELGMLVPLLIGTGGNAGSQAVGTVIRGMALGEIENQDLFRVVTREATTGVLLGTSLGLIGFSVAFVLCSLDAKGFGEVGLLRDLRFATVIGLSVLGICVWANTVGAAVPILARRLGIDPAVISAPMISTLVDTTGLVIFYTIALILLFWTDTGP